MSAKQPDNNITRSIARLAASPICTVDEFRDHLLAACGNKKAAQNVATHLHSRGLVAHMMVLQPAALACIDAECHTGRGDERTVVHRPCGSWEHIDHPADAHHVAMPFERVTP